MGSMSGSGGNSGGGGLISQLLAPPIPFKSGAKPGQTPPPAQPVQPHPLVGPQPQAQNPLTQYIMALTSMHNG